jgi:hypothetical protein
VSQAEGVLITGVYGSGKSSVAAEIAYLLEQQERPFVLLDLHYLSWVGPVTGDRAGEIDRRSRRPGARDHRQRQSRRHRGPGDHDLPQLALAGRRDAPESSSCVDTVV